ncbi:predicted protein [Naegleria gruberi]|uniref:Predicted protein n=1 Tax=Naegleria gruberi TaxID=5762 RepID=D2W0B2_NAEGR|nr:uncharacterized protein NAEGRDRAFT_74795 [Naegleria gruberi]EFC37402.1 predicted protein [Naegleria gruberi]|eukprot:XP_002670146.1 predicted protein [Naegleria gruberi strain NEG-M]
MKQQINNVNLLLMIIGCLLIMIMIAEHVSSQRVILSMTSISQTPYLYTGYFTPDVRNQHWNWVGSNLQGITNPFYGELSIPIQGFDPIIYRGHLSANTNFVSNTFPFALMSVAITPNSFNGTFSIEGSIQCGDNVTGGGALSGLRFKGITIDGKSENHSGNCFNYQCHCAQCRDSVTVAMSVCYQSITPKPSFLGK